MINTEKLTLTKHTVSSTSTTPTALSRITKKPLNTKPSPPNWGICSWGCPMLPKKIGKKQKNVVTRLSGFLRKTETAVRFY